MDNPTNNANYLLGRGWSDEQIIRYLVDAFGLTEQYARLHLAAMRGELKSDRFELKEADDAEPS